jgi:hypothetical protein
MSLTREQVEPGVTVIVPKGADVIRPGLTYQLRIKTADSSHMVGCVFVAGYLLRADGSPSTAKHAYRVADIELAAIDLAPTPAMAG